MSHPWQEFPVTDALKINVTKLLNRKDEIFSLESDPLLASLISCLGLQF